MPSINEILANEDFGQVVSTLCVDTIEFREPREYYREYHGDRRRRKTSVGWREPKRLAVYSETLKDKNGDPLRLEDKIVDVARIVTNFPKKGLICKFPWHERPSLTKDGQSLYSDYPIKRPTYPFRSMLCNMNE